MVSLNKKLQIGEEEHISEQMRIRQSLVEEFERVSKGIILGTCDMRHVSREHYFYIEMRNLLYRVREKPGNAKFIREYLERGNLVEGHINLMKYESNKKKSRLSVLEF